MVVLLDMWMPRMNGEATLMATLAQGRKWSRLSFIVMTANPQRMTAHARDLIERYDIPLLVKPFDIDLFSDLVSRRARRLSRPERRRA
jgi:DNA-binding NtrC family response regulator